jgi:hypothetical protein
MVWQDWSHLNKKYADVWLAGLGGGVFDGGDVLQSQPMMGLGASGLGAMSSGDIELLQTLLNYELTARNRAEIAITAGWDVATCVALTFLLQQYQATPPTSDSTGAWIIDIWNENMAAILAACEAVKAGATPLPPPPPTNGGITNGGTTTTNGGYTPGGVCTAAGCDCYVYEGDEGPHITDLQQQLNAALDANGYEGIVATGVYDKETCGAIFELTGTFRPEFPGTHCNTDMTQEWLVPLECPDMVLPKKKGGVSRASMFAIGGLVLAAGLGGAYWIAQS